MPVENIFKRKPAAEIHFAFNQPLPEPVAVYGPRQYLPSKARPGSELKAIFKALGISACVACKLLAKQMNRWGVDGCRDNRDYIIEQLTKRMDELGMGERLVIAARGVATGLAFKLDLADVVGSLVDEAIRRAEQATSA